MNGDGCDDCKKGGGTGFDGLDCLILEDPPSPAFGPLLADIPAAAALCRRQGKESGHSDCVSLQSMVAEKRAEKETN